VKGGGGGQAPLASWKEGWCPPGGNTDNKYSFLIFFKQLSPISGLHGFVSDTSPPLHPKFWLHEHTDMFYMMNVHVQSSYSIFLHTYDTWSTWRFKNHLLILQLPQPDISEQQF
jgi:hypothetical protein